ncbi:unnamed protein product [Rotaria sordida]|uniref:Uncharacterized protein n=1 Tax=Rotaria sordida TaxID=392033 RepID=A0A819QM69_9BILA|nr:unnamed protein product [Rotaria sordida]CAF0959017.1 unnamed protein product [Rotaria sordida]CAF3851945.1 unnamed protein product [Rotaria sordida]CAF4027785.1 unnamed protein product [Rotaria sordida]
MGPVNNVLEVQQKWRFLCDLAVEKLQWPPSTEHLSSAAIRSGRPSTGAAIKHALAKTIKRWLRKPTNITKQNLPPFSPSGDINDAVFPIPEYVLKYFESHVESFSQMQSSSMKLRYTFEHDIFKRPIEKPFKRTFFGPPPVDKERTYGECTQTSECISGVSQVFSNESIAIDDESQIPARLPLLPVEILSMKKTLVANRRKLDDSDIKKTKRKDITEYSVKKYVTPTRQELQPYFEKFAQRMQENAIQFERLCSMTAAITP